MSRTRLVFVYLFCIVETKEHSETAIKHRIRTTIARTFARSNPINPYAVALRAEPTAIGQNGSFFPMSLKSSILLPQHRHCLHHHHHPRRIHSLGFLRDRCRGQAPAQVLAVAL